MATRKQDWSPRRPGKMPRVEDFEHMARTVIGDGELPDIFFVSARGNVQTITLDFETAYEQWLRLARGKRFECALEDRLYGTICSVEPRDDTDPTLVRVDDSRSFLEMHEKDVRYEGD